MRHATGTTKKAPRWRRWALGAAAAVACAPWLGACSAGFESPSQITGVRVINVTLDKPYAQPGDAVTFQMSYEAAGAYKDVPLQILWIGGCYDPPGDLYYGCYTAFQGLLEAYQSGSIMPTGTVGLGPSFTEVLPDTFITDHPLTATGEAYGVGYVFFAVCAGTLQPLPSDQLAAGGPAGSFPIGCFDAAGNQVSADGFVPGFTQVYGFADARENFNPQAKSILFKLDTDDDSAYLPLSDDATAPASAELCSIDEQLRRQSGCGKDPFTQCTVYRFDVDVDDTIADIDPDADAQGNVSREAVWVDWYVDGGDLDNDVSLIYDPTAGLNDDRSVGWIAPPEPGIVHVWAAIHDARGGGSVLSGYVEVK